MKDLRRELMKLQVYSKSMPSINPKPIHKIFVDDHWGLTVAEFHSENSAIEFVLDNPGMGYSVRIYKPTEDEYLDQCYENRREWRWNHGIGG